MKVSQQPLWLLYAQRVFEANGLSATQARDAAMELAVGLDQAGHTSVWENDPKEAAERQIAEWDSHKDGSAS